ncbi:MAG: DUF1285 domain-containing protein [Beijerinckiaceae bacterium]
MTDTLEQRRAENEAGQLGGITMRARTMARSGKTPPVHKWHPPYCGELDIRIKTDGTWHYLGSPIGRLPLVKLFASVLRKDPERYVLVTPVEMVGITVDDVPFVAVEMQREGAGREQTLTFRTNVDDRAVASASNPLRFERDSTGGLKPEILVRGDLWAKLSRPLLYDLVDLGAEAEHEGQPWFGIWSGGSFFPIAPMSAIDTIG